MVDAIRRVLRGEIVVSPAVSSRMVARAVEGDAPPVSLVSALSDRELEVFQLIGRGVGTRTIAETLHLSVKTIETYRAHIKDKLKLKNATELLQHATQWVQAGGQG